MDIKTILGGSNPYVQAKVDKGDGTEAAAAAKTKAKATGQAASGDRVSVSSDAKLVAEAARAAQASPDIRVEKVEALRAQVESGSYSPNSRSIAEKLVASDLEFLR